MSQPSNPDLIELVSCCVCKDILQTNIMLVNNVGNVCENCFNNENNKDLFKNCVSVPNEPLENYLSRNDVKVKCEHAQNGCQDILNGKNKNEHEKICKYRLVYCPFQDIKQCYEEILFVEMLEHFNVHKNEFISIQNASFEISFNQNYSKTGIKVLSLNEHIFLLKYNIDLSNSKLLYDFFYCSNNEETINIPNHEIKFYGSEEEESLDLKKKTVSFKEYYNVSRKSIEIDLNAIKQFVNATENIKFKLGFNEKMPEKLIELMECPICNNLMQPPIFLCNSGHSICNECKKKINECPTCREPFTTKSRNYLAEEILSSNWNLLPKLLPKIKCKNINCNFENTQDLMKEHEKNCPFRPNICPICGEAMKEEEKSLHYKNYHGRNRKSSPLSSRSSSFIKNRLIYIFFDINNLNNLYLGRLIIELRSDLIPKTVEHIRKLSVNNRYNGLSVHRDYISIGNNSKQKIDQENCNLKYTGLDPVAVRKDTNLSVDISTILILRHEYQRFENTFFVIGSVLDGMDIFDKYNDVRDFVIIKCRELL